MSQPIEPIESEEPQEPIESKRPGTIKEWVMMVVIALGVATAVILPAYLIVEVRDQAALARESMIQVNVATIACLNQLEDETRETFEACIREGLQVADEFIGPSTTSLP